MKNTRATDDADVMQGWYVYILHCADDTLYTGITTDPLRRVQQHNRGTPRGARYTHTRRPVTLAYTESAPDRAAALRREYAIKQLDAQHKRALCAQWRGS